MKPKIITVGRISYILSLALALGAFISIYKWNDVLSATTVLGFIALAQHSIGKYFSGSNGDPAKKQIVLMLALAYSALFITCLINWNIPIALEVVGGFVPFCLRLNEGYFDDTPSTLGHSDTPSPVPQSAQPSTLNPQPHQ